MRHRTLRPIPSVKSRISRPEMIQGLGLGVPLKGGYKGHLGLYEGYVGFRHKGFHKSGVLFGGPSHRDGIILGSILVSPIYGSHLLNHFERLGVGLG